MAHAYTDVEGGLGNFIVTKSNPSGTTVRFTVGDSGNLLTTPKMIRAVLCNAIDYWIASEREDLNSNGDSHVKGSDEYGGPGTGDGFSEFTFNFGSKYAEVVLSALSGISNSGTITVAVPYADVV